MTAGGTRGGRRGRGARVARRSAVLLGWVLLGTALAIFTVVLYLPASRDLELTRQRVSGMEREIESVLAPIAGAASLQEGIVALHGRLRRLEERLPDTQELSTILKAISEEAEAFAINLISIKPGATEYLVSPEGEWLTAGSHICLRFPIALEFECRYRSLGEYLEALTRDLPGLITIDELVIAKEEGILPNLTVRLVISAYFLGELAEESVGGLGSRRPRFEETDRLVAIE